MLPFLLFAGAMSINVHQLRKDKAMDEKEKIFQDLPAESRRNSPAEKCIQHLQPKKL